MKPPELKPCPFCGSMKLKIFPSFVACAECEGMGPDKTADRSAVERWNTRAEVKPKQFYQYDVQSDITAEQAATIAPLYDLYLSSRAAFSAAVEALPPELKRHFQLVDADLWFVMDDPLKVKGAANET